MAPQVIRFGRIGRWTILASGPQELALAGSLAANIHALGRPAKLTGAWLKGDANVARFDRLLPFLNNLDNLPVAHFSLSNRDDFVRTMVTLDFPKPHRWKTESWLIPTNNIFDPLCSFTAARGVAPIFDAIPSVRQLGWTPTPNQVSGWGVARQPFQFFYATPTRDVTNQLHKITPILQAMIFPKEQTNLVGAFSETNGTGVDWLGLPMAVPRLEAISPSFLAFEMFPMAPGKTLAPNELFQQLARDNLVYYDWEITEERILSWRQMYQIAEIATRRQLSPANTPGARWVEETRPKLGEAVTEITVSSPTQMTLVRKSHLGLTSFELVTLSRWIEAANFPALDIFPPQQARVLAAGGDGTRRR